MLIVGVIGSSGKSKAINTISSLLQSSKRKINLIESFENNAFDIRNIKEYIEAINKNNRDVLIICISHDGIQKGFYESIDFDIIVHTGILPEYYSSEAEFNKIIEIERKFFSKIGTKSYIIMSIDDDFYIKLIQGLNLYMLSYGFNSKSTITASSVNDNDNKITVCQQRSIKPITGNRVEPQEFLININNCENQDIYNALASVSLGLLFNIKTERFSEVVF